jgi:hypothetical protein
MTGEQLLDWIEACSKMERWFRFSKARRSWKEGRRQALAELEKRQNAARNLAPAEPLTTLAEGAARPAPERKR